MQELSFRKKVRQPAGPGKDEQSTLELLCKAAAEQPGDDLLKHVQLRRAILALVHAGDLVPGQQLPAEQKLAAALGLSLGPVRQCLGRLGAEGVLLREHGRGTFVAGPARTNYRFVDPGGIAPGVLARHVRTARAAPPAAAVPLFGEPAPLGAACIRIDRTIAIGGEMTCYSEFFVDAARFEGLLDIPVFDGTRMHEVLATRFNAPTMRVMPYVRATAFAPHVRRHVGARHTEGMLLELAATTLERRPLSYQTIFIPQGPFRLDISNLIVPIAAEDICGL